MQDVMWVFSGAADADVKADTEMLLALRTELSDHLKIMDRVLCFSGGTEAFKQDWSEIEGACCRSQGEGKVKGKGVSEENPDDHNDLWYDMII